jgi:hypothetical protein
MKYVAVTGGVVSGLGKGITSSSIGVLLKAAGLNVTSIKIDPYLVSRHPQQPDWTSLRVELCTQVLALCNVAWSLVMRILSY